MAWRGSLGGRGDRGRSSFSLVEGSITSFKRGTSFSSCISESTKTPHECQKHTEEVPVVEKIKAVGDGGHKPGQLKSREMMVSPAAGASRARTSGFPFRS